MSSLLTESTGYPQTVPLSYGQDLCPGPRINHEPLSDPTGGSTLDMAVGNDRGWSALDRGDEAPRPWYFDCYTPATFMPLPVCVQSVPQSYPPHYEASTARLPAIRVHTNVSQAQPCETGEYVIIQRAPDRGKRTSTRPEVQHSCADCNTKFKRIQEFRRHMRDKHGPPRQCPFCGFTWTRPNRIKTHILFGHQDKLAHGTVGTLDKLYGQRIVTFVEGLITGP
jgi:hypothetical protein